MVLNRIGPVSLAKVLGTIYAILGLIIGTIISGVVLFGVGFAPGNDPNSWLSGLLGLGAIVLLPLFYGAVGFVAGLVVAAIYNRIRPWVGGLELDLQ